MARRQRIDSATAAIETMRRASVDIDPPAHLPLSGEDLVFFREVIAEKPRSEWTKHDISIAAQLAQAMADLAKARAGLRATGGGPILGGRNGDQLVNNPWQQAVRDETARIVALRTTLQIHGRGKNGEKRDVEKRRGAAAQIEDNLAADGDALLAGIRVN